MHTAVCSADLAGRPAPHLTQGLLPRSLSSDSEAPSPPLSLEVPNKLPNGLTAGRWVVDRWGKSLKQLQGGDSILAGAQFTLQSVLKARGAEMIKHV